MHKPTLILRGSILLEDLPSGRGRAPGHGPTGSFVIARTDTTGSDFRAKGRLQDVGAHHLQFADTKEYWLKAGPDAPENLLAYVDFDGTRSNRRRPALPGEAIPDGLKTWAPYVPDWRSGDPTWKGGKGKGLIGALNKGSVTSVKAGSRVSLGSPPAAAGEDWLVVVRG